MDQKRCPRAVSSSALRTLPPGTLVNAIRSALAFVILLECFASILSLATPDEMPKADKATIKITERRKSLGFMIQVRLIPGFIHEAPTPQDSRLGCHCCVLRSVPILTGLCQLSLQLLSTDFQ